MHTDATSITSRAALSMPAKVLVVEDHALVAMGLQLALGARGWTVETTDGPTAADIVEHARQFQPRCVLLDIELGDSVGSGIELIAPLRATGAHVVMLTAESSRMVLASCLEAGAAGWISKDAFLDEVVTALDDVLAGRPLIGATSRDTMIDELRIERAGRRRALEPFERLTTREARRARLPSPRACQPRRSPRPTSCRWRPFARRSAASCRSSASARSSPPWPRPTGSAGRRERATSPLPEPHRSRTRVGPAPEPSLDWQAAVSEPIASNTTTPPIIHRPLTRRAPRTVRTSEGSTSPRGSSSSIGRIGNRDRSCTPTVGGDDSLAGLVHDWANRSRRSSPVASADGSGTRNGAGALPHRRRVPTGDPTAPRRPVTPRWRP